MEEEIKIRRLSTEEGGGYMAEYLNLKGCMADGETKEEALRELENAKVSWLMAAKEFGIDEKVHYKRINVTFPESLLKRLDAFLKDDLHMSRSAFFQRLVAKELKLSK